LRRTLVLTEYAWANEMASPCLYGKTGSKHFASCSGADVPFGQMIFTGSVQLTALEILKAPERDQEW